MNLVMAETKICFVDVDQVTGCGVLADCMTERMQRTLLRLSAASYIVEALD